MKSITSIKKTFMVSAIVVFVTFGAFAMSLAYESSPVAPLYSASPRHTPGDGLLRSETFAQRLAMICFSGDVPRSAQPNFQAYCINHFRVADPLGSAVFLEMHVSKVSLQILQSVLLI